MRRLKPKGFIESSTLGVAQARGWRYGRIGRRRENVRGEYRVSSLVKQNKKAKICFVIHITGERKLLFYIYAVIVKQIFYKRPSNQYWRPVCLPFLAPLSK